MKSLLGKTVLFATALTTISFASASSLGGFSWGGNASGYKPKTKVSLAPVINFETGEKVRRAFSRLKRTEDGLCYEIKTKQLPEGTYTNWWVIFNNPENCANPDPIGGLSCGMGDMGNPEVSTTVMWATGGIVGQSGKTNFSACVDVGEFTHAVLPMGTGDGLLNPEGAEVQLVIRYHGPGKYSDAEALGEQINSFMGGCSDPQAGIVDYDCFDPQMVFHKTPR